eukprot:g33064.t1
MERKSERAQSQTTTLSSTKQKKKRMESKSERAQAQPTSLSSTHSQKMERKSERAQSPLSTLSSTDTQSQTERMERCEPPPHPIYANLKPGYSLTPKQRTLVYEQLDKNGHPRCQGRNTKGEQCGISRNPKFYDQPSPIQASLDDEDEDQQPHFKETTHEHTTIQPLERAMRPDSPTHEQGLQEEQKSDQQDEISIEQSLADDQDTNLSTGPIPSSDFTAPEEPHTDPNRCKKARAESEKRTSYATSSLDEIRA